MAGGGNSGGEIEIRDNGQRRQFGHDDGRMETGVGFGLNDGCLAGAAAAAAVALLFGTGLGSPLFLRTATMTRLGRLRFGGNGGRLPGADVNRRVVRNGLATAERHRDDGGQQQAQDGTDADHKVNQLGNHTRFYNTAKVKKCMTGFHWSAGRSERKAWPPAVCRASACAGEVRATAP